MSEGFGMDALLLIVVPFVGFIIAYWTYGRWLARKIFKLDDSRPVPATYMHDGIDYVPTKKGIIFGHHFTSIAGTGPIVGPAIAIIWGWVPAIIWVVVGSIFMGAVHDFGSLVISMRNQGKSLSEITAKYINPRVRTIFFGIVFLELWIVIAIFGLVIAVLFKMYPEAVFPIWMEVPIAIGLGYAVYKRGGNIVYFTLVAVIVMYITVIGGHYLPVRLPSQLLGIPVTGWWTIALLAYAYIASTLRVTTLLQPRDYINAWQLFLVMALLIVGALASSATGRLHVVAPPVNTADTGAPPIWPFLFVTIACGAISGFHSLVSSGTSSKQICKESHAQFVGYGSMLMEGALAVLIIIAVAAGIGMVSGTDIRLNETALTAGQRVWGEHYGSWSSVTANLGAKLAAAVEGSANMLSTLGIPEPLGIIIIGVFIASFAGTTLDSATRIQRYAIGELATSFRVPVLANRYIATAIAVVTAGLLAFSTGAGGVGAMTLWPMFGAVNQLLAALALLVVTIYLRRRGGWAFLVTGIPCVFMLALTIWAVLYNEHTFLFSADPKKRSVLLACINGAVLVLAIWMIVETARTFFRPIAGEDKEVEPAGAGPEPSTAGK